MRIVTFHVRLENKNSDADVFSRCYVLLFSKKKIMLLRMHAKEGPFFLGNPWAPFWL